MIGRKAERLNGKYLLKVFSFTITDSFDKFHSSNSGISSQCLWRRNEIPLIQEGSARFRFRL